MMQLVSVIIPCYKDSATLARAILSVQCQTYPAIEIVVVNDCSPETELIEKCLLSYPQVKYWRNQVNVGLASTRNTGIAISSGEIIAFLDADDEYHPDKIAKQVEALEDNTVLTCGLVNVFPNGRKFEKQKKNYLVLDTSKLLYSNALNGAGLLAPKTLLLQHGGYNPDLRSCEDFELWLRLLSAGVKVKNIGLPLYLYHYNQAGLSKNFRNISKWELEVIKLYAFRMKPEWLDSPRYATIVLVWLFRHLMRSELVNDKELRLQTITNMNLLSNWPLTRIVFRFLAYSRIVVIPAFLLRSIRNIS